MLAALGANIELPADAVWRCLEATGVAFLFAPVFHPAFKAIAPVRKKLAQRTIFNILGPLLNPARPTHQLVGVFNPLLVPTFAEVLRMTGLTRALVVHGAGMDELSVHGLNTLAELRDGKIQQSELQMPETQGDLRGGDAAARRHRAPLGEAGAGGGLLAPAGALRRGLFALAPGGVAGRRAAQGRAAAGQALRHGQVQGQVRRRLDRSARGAP